MKQGLVEIAQDPPVPSLNDAILIPRKLIEDKNTEIKTQGNEKINLMEKIMNIKFDVAKAEYELKRQ